MWVDGWLGRKWVELAGVWWVNGGSSGLVGESVSGWAGGGKLSISPTFDLVE